MEPTYQPPVSSGANRLLFKGLLIGGLILLLLIPAMLLRGLVNERAGRQQEVVAEVSSKWAGAQTIVGPVLAVPYRQTITNASGKPGILTRFAFFLPDVLKADSRIAPKERHRSLYTVLLYRSSLQLTGRFNPLPLGELQLAPEAVDWSGARLLLGINDARGLEEEVRLNWNGTTRTLDAGLPQNDAVRSGLQASVSLNATTGVNFSINLSLKGSSQLYVTPVGKTTVVRMSSPWKTPAFDGPYLPSESAVATDTGFTAIWKVLHVSRPFPQMWKGDSPNLAASAFGVRLVQPADGYAKTERSVKYALLFIALTFAVFFFIEALQKRPVHPLQYLLVGLALCIFYTLLLAISEYTGFDVAYAIATTATVGLIGSYTYSLFNRLSIALGFGGALTGLYGFIYIIIQQEDRALLFGAIGLFLILALLMYFSRKIDWYGHRDAPAAATL